MGTTSGAFFRFGRRFAFPIGCIFLLFLSYPYLFTRFSSGIPRADASDQLYIMSIIQYLIHAPLDMAYHLPYFYPSAYVTTYGHPLFGIALIFKLFQLLGLSLTQSANLYIVMALLAGTLGCYALIREVCGDARWAAAIAVFYLVCPRNYVHFVWFNFLSNFWIPWIVTLFLKYFRSGRRRYLVGAAFCVFYQFFTEIYYGVHLILILLPLLLAAALWQKMLSPRRLIAVLVSLLVVGLLIIAIFYPFVGSARSQGFERAYHPDTLMLPRELFTSSRLLGLFSGGEPGIGKILFPGLALAFLLLAFFAGSGKKRAWVLAGLGTMELLLVALAIRGGTMLEVLFVILLASLAVLAWRNWAQFSPAERVLVAASSAFFLLLIGFENLRFLNAFQPYGWIYEHVPGMAGLRGIKRIYPMFFPFWLTLAAVAGLRLERTARVFRRVPRGVVPLCVCALIILENVRFDYGGISRPLPEKEAVYAALPYEGNKVVMDWPCSFGQKNPEGTRRQMFSWGYHHNVLVNGKTSFLPGFVYRFGTQIGSVERAFPTEDKLRRLINYNSVDYVVFHFDEHEGRRGHADLGDVRGRIASIRNYGEVVYTDPDHVLLRVREMRTVARAVRTYASYHLSRCNVRARWEAPCRGPIRVLLNGRASREFEGQGRNELILDLRHERLEVEGNRLEIIFPEPVRLVEIALVPGGPGPDR
jgi:hypothetical protein